ncbi:hypothetical protein HT102_12330 [Hoyosella sp. G463]|uniref:Uncharacterized protein n=1 Tax=Lolliginicoccus lacisalsi TaxID=2742202 RepID=A0A927JDY7_9ACTN|nr:hypothetical protein [Lolliginicoccus lacisalsi]MBD8507271.1 hypothetical protein [Lolliginicoccus lacisalsi]
MSRKDVADEQDRDESSDQGDKAQEQKDREQWNEGNETGNELSGVVDDLEEDIVDERDREGATGNVRERAEVEPVGSESDDVPD